MWRWVGLRGTGFPAAQVLKLSDPICSRAADQLIQAEDELQRKCEQAINTVREALNKIRLAGEWGNVEKRQPVVKALRSLTKGKVPPPAQVTDEIRPAVEEFGSASAERDVASATFRQSYGDAQIKEIQALQEAASAKRFQEAVIWQNRQAFHSALIPLLSKPSGADGGGSKQRRRHKELVANYLQRYSVKNDTIGFFGPMGWARLVSQGETLTVRPGPDLIAARGVYFESWCIDTLAESLSRNVELRPWITPRRVPYLRLAGDMLLLPLAPPTRLPPQLAMALQLCDGKKTACEIAHILTRAFPTIVRGEKEAYHLLEQISVRGLISWKFEIPTQLFPERTLRRLLERVEDESLRASALATLDELERGRDRVARAAGDPENLDRALAELEDSFTRLSGATSTRSAGKMYAARTLVYEDCRRDIEVELGPEFLQPLGPPLSLLLTSARWFTFQVAEFYRRAFKEIYRDLARLKGSPEVDGAAFWYRVRALIYDKEKSAGQVIRPIFQRLWAEILSVPAGLRHVRYSVEELRPLVEQKFAAPRAGWPFARYHSPDVMIVASGAEAIRRGDYQMLLGEFHLSANTLMGSMFVDQHPHPEEIIRNAEQDLPAHALRIVPPKSLPGLTARTNPVLLSSENHLLMVTHDSFCDPNKQGMPVGELIVEETGGDLFVRTHDGRLRFDIIEAFSDLLSSRSANLFKMLKPRTHMPRISFDQLVVLRESWSFAADELPFAYVKDDAERFLNVRRWAQLHDMPRFVFVKSPIETKPFYVDFESPLYTDILSKVVRRTKESDEAESLITFSEMLPDHSQTWLTDAEGLRYTSELRLVAVDPSP